MIVIAAIFHARPELEADLETALLAMLPSAATESGTLDYSVHRSRDNPGVFFLYEKYADQAALDTHMASVALKTLLERLPQLCAQDPQIEFCTPLGNARAQATA